MMLNKVIIEALYRRDLARADKKYANMVEQAEQIKEERLSEIGENIKHPLLD